MALESLHIKVTAGYPESISFHVMDHNDVIKGRFAVEDYVLGGDRHPRLSENEADEASDKNLMELSKIFDNICNSQGIQGNPV